jgi:hypothetical protein
MLTAGAFAPSFLRDTFSASRRQPRRHLPNVNLEEDSASPIGTRSNLPVRPASRLSLGGASQSASQSPPDTHAVTPDGHPRIICQESHPGNSAATVLEPQFARPAGQLQDCRISTPIGQKSRLRPSQRRLRSTPGLLRGNGLNCHCLGNWQGMALRGAGDPLEVQPTNRAACYHERGSPLSRQMKTFDAPFCGSPIRSASMVRRNPPSPCCFGTGPWRHHPPPGEAA